MFRWLNFILWTAAWGIWVWLGVGLAHQLPRQPSKPLCNVPVSAKNQCFGFIGDTNHLLMVQIAADQQTTFVVVDAETGATVRSTPGPHRGDMLQLSLPPNHRNHLFCISRARSRVDEASRPGLVAIQLTAFEGRLLSEILPAAVRLHPTNPWLAFGLPLSSRERKQRIAVVDYETGRTVRLATEVPFGPLSSSPQFIPNSDLVIVFAGKHRLTQFRDGRTAEIWDVSAEPKLVKAISNVEIGDVTAIAANGIIAFCERSRGSAVSVYDLLNERFVFPTSPEQARSEPHPVFGGPMRFSPSGKRFLANSSANGMNIHHHWLWDAQTGAAVWRPGRHEASVPAGGEEFFQTTETWSELWKDWFPNVSFVTRAMRSVEDGSLVRRTANMTYSLHNGFNSAGTLVVTQSGDVFRWPLPINWPLLAACQAVLASPLVALWALLRWGRRRRQALNPSASSPVSEPISPLPTA